MTTPVSPSAFDLLKRAESYLSALHGSVARHDNLAANLGCAGCDLRDKISATLPSLATGRAAAFREAADELGRMDYDTDADDYGYDTYRDAWNGGVMDGAGVLRDMADEAAKTRCGQDIETSLGTYPCERDTDYNGDCDERTEAELGEQPAPAPSRAAVEEPATETGAPFSSHVARLVAEDARALRMDLYDDLNTYARQTGNTGLQQAQIRDHLSEFLLEGLLRRSVGGERLRCPRCRTDITDYAEDDHVFRTGDERPYCSGECVIAAHRAAASQPGKEA